MRKREHEPLINLKIMRIKRGITQRELAEKVGVTNNTISMYERGERFPKVKTLYKMAQILECDCWDII